MWELHIPRESEEAVGDNRGDQHGIQSRQYVAGYSTGLG